MAVQVFAVSHHLQTCVVIGQCDRHAQLDVGQVSHHTVVALRCDDRLAYLTTPRKVLDIHAVRAREAVCLHGPAVVERDRDVARLSHICQFFCACLFDAGLHQQAGLHQLADERVFVPERHLRKLQIVFRKRVGRLARGRRFFHRRVDVVYLEQRGELVVRREDRPLVPRLDARLQLAAACLFGVGAQPWDIHLQRGLRHHTNRPVKHVVLVLREPWPQGVEHVPRHVDVGVWSIRHVVVELAHLRLGWVAHPLDVGQRLRHTVLALEVLAARQVKVLCDVAQPVVAHHVSN